MSDRPFVEKHIHAWTTVYELIDRITVNRCAFRLCSGISVRQWENEPHTVTIYPNGTVEIVP